MWEDVNKVNPKIKENKEVIYMGFIKAFAGAIGGTFADQWKEYIVPMQGVPATAAVFPAVQQSSNAGRGENNFKVRQAVCNYLGFLGVEMDEAANTRCGEEIKISTDASRTAVYVIPTNEEHAIARETVALLP